MKVLFYGRLAEAMGAERDIAAAPGCCVGDVRQSLIAGHPEVEGVLRNRRALTFVGDRLVRDDHPLAAGETLEFLPPVSGG